MLVACVMVAPAVAQERAAVATDENFRLDPSGDGRILARVTEGTEVRLGAARNGWREVTIEGWIWGPSVRRSGSPGFDLAVSASGGENLREEPNGRILARLETGALLEEVRRADRWIRVRRTAWMWEASLSPIRVSPAPQPPPVAPRETPRDRPAEAALEQGRVVAGASLLSSPDGDTLARLAAPGSARIVARADGWARVLVEAWVREPDLGPANDSALAGVTAAEVRGGGAAYEGRTLRWTLQVIAVQTADELRRDMPIGQRYLLARGPMPETGFVYVLLTAEQARVIETLEPLSRLSIVGRVRRARSQYLGNPILDLLEFRVDRGP